MYARMPGRNMPRTPLTLSVSLRRDA